MTGNKRVGIVLQERDRRLLKELGVMRIIDRETTKVVAGFGSTRRANSRLLALTRTGLLRRFFVGTVAHGRKAMYTLSPKGTETIGSLQGGIKRPSGRLVVGDRFVEHQSVINDVYVALKYRSNLQINLRLRRWISFQRELTEAIKIKPDAYCEIQNDALARAMFHEVDLGTEALSVWQKKAAYYVQLAVSGDFHQRFRQPQFRVLVIANSERRLANIRTAVAKSTDKIFWFATIESIKREGIWSAVWLRPTGDQRHSFL